MLPAKAWNLRDMMMEENGEMWCFLEEKRVEIIEEDDDDDDGDLIKSICFVCLNLVFVYSNVQQCFWSLHVYYAPVML